MAKQYYTFGASKGSSFMFDYDTDDRCCALCKNIYSNYNDPFITIPDDNGNKVHQEIPSDIISFHSPDLMFTFSMYKNRLPDSLKNTLSTILGGGFFLIALRIK